MRGAAWVVGLGVWAAALGCAPSQARLLADRHYPEALAGVDEAALDGHAVLAAIAVELELGLHVEAVSAAALRAQLPGAPAGFDELALVRIIHASHAVTLDRYDVDVVLVRAGAEVAEVDGSLASLAARTGETLPVAETVAHAARHDVRLVQTTRFPLAELFGRITLNIATVGLIHPVVPIVRDHGTPAYTEVREPTAADYARASPAAAAVHEWIGWRSCPSAGLRCEQWRLWPRAGEGDAAIDVEVRLDRGGALRYRIPLPPGSLEAGLAAVFGGQERRLAQLASEVEIEYAWTLEFDGEALERDDLRRVCARVHGRGGEPGLGDRPDLRVTIEAAPDDPDAQLRAPAVREALIACGLAPARVEVVAGEGYSWPTVRIVDRLD